MSSALDLLREVCSGLPHVERAMFGGHGFFAPNGGMFAGIVTDDEVIFKLADETARAGLISEGGHAWQYRGRASTMTMGQWIVVPEHFYDDLELFTEWAKKAHALAPAKVAKKKSAASKRAEPPARKKVPARLAKLKAAKPASTRRASKKRK